MLITYLVTVYNKEKYIANVIDSLKSIKGNFRKEFIIIDDGSTDKSLEAIKVHTASLTKTTVIYQQNQGPALAVNNALRLAGGDYMHFVDGDDVIAEDATTLLLKACTDFGTEVAYGLRGKFNHESGARIPSKREAEDVMLIDMPINAILKGKIPGVRSIGSSGSLISRSLLEKSGGADPEVFVQDLSISLRCAKHSKFAFVQKSVAYSPFDYDAGNLSHDKRFEAHNSLKAILRFIKNNEEIALRLRPELQRTLWSTLWKLDKLNFSNLWHYVVAKYTNKDIDYTDLVALYSRCANALL